MDPFFAFAAFLFGLTFGSFLNVCIYRLPRDLSVVSPRSACPQCGRQIAFYDNIPIISWLLLRGRCRNCQGPISPRYIFVELLTGGLFLACYWHFGPTLATLKYCVFGFLLLGLIFTDAETKLLPNKLTLTGLMVGLAFSLVVPVNDLASKILPGVVALPFRPDISSRLLSLLDSALGAALGASFIYGAGAIYLKVRHAEGMGFGDVKLMAMVGAFLGVKLTVFTLFAGSVTGSLFGVATIAAVWIKRRRRFLRRPGLSTKAAKARAWKSTQLVWRRYEMPFGVFLGSMALFALFYGNQLLTWYWGLM